jgi:hypothetical protein
VAAYNLISAALHRNSQRGGLDGADKTLGRSTFLPAFTV